MSVGPIHNHLPLRLEGALSLGKDELIKRVALPIFLEMAVSIALGAAVCLFTVSTGGVGLIICALVVQCAASSFFRFAGVFAANEALKGGAYRKLFEQVAEVADWLCPMSFMLGTGLNAQTLIHERGHALAAMLVYKNARAKIHLVPFKGGWTDYYPRTGLTEVGAKLGAKGAETAVVAAGAGLSLSVSAALLAAGLLMKKKHPTLSKVFIAWGAIDFAHHIFYAFSAFFTSAKDKAHDFVHLTQLGIHPTIAIARMIAVPMLLNLGINALVRSAPKQRLTPVII